MEKEAVIVAGRLCETTGSELIVFAVSTAETGGLAFTGNEARRDATNKPPPITTANSEMMMSLSFKLQDANCTEL